jgi:seryl-tRNA synthetase
MSTLSIQAGPAGLAASGTAPGSPAERAYQRAVKALTMAQNRLAKDLGERADENTIKQDTMAVQQAAAAVANALAALEHEKEKQTQADGRPSSTATVLAALVEAKNTVDLYA